MKYKISRYWNRLAFAIIKLGIFAIWDQTKSNKYLIDAVVDEVEVPELILCDRS